MANGQQKGAENVEKLAPEVLIDHDLPVGPDGNSVVMEREVSEMLKNSLMYKMYMRLLRGRYRKLMSAIVGR